MQFGTLGHYAALQVGKGHEAILGFLAEHDPDGMSEAEIDAKLAQLQAFSVEVSKAHTKSDQDKATYDAAVKQNDIALSAAERMQAKIDAMPAGSQQRADAEAALKDHLDETEANQQLLASYKSTYESAKAFYENVQRLYDERSSRLKTMKSQYKIAANTMKSEKLREQQAEEQAAAAKRLAGGSGSVDKFNVALSAMQKATQNAREHAEAAERFTKSVTATPASNSFVEEAMREASGQAAPPTSAADRIAALRKQAA